LSKPPNKTAQRKAMILLVPFKDVWLYICRLEDNSMKYALCNAPADTSTTDIRKPALMRWSIEQCFRECKEYLGTDHYEVRSWTGWHRHILITLIAHLFVIKLRRQFSIKPHSPGPVPFIEQPVFMDQYVFNDPDSKEKGWITLRHFHGESLLHPHFDEAIKYAQENNIVK
jgi:hypothetical protein